MSEYKPERVGGAILIKGEWAAPADVTLATAAQMLANAREVAARCQAVFDFLLAERDEELARRLFIEWLGHAPGERFENLPRDDQNDWRRVAAVAREHFEGEQ